MNTLLMASGSTLSQLVVVELGRQLLAGGNKVSFCLDSGLRGIAIGEDFNWVEFIPEETLRGSTEVPEGLRYRPAHIFIDRLLSREKFDAVGLDVNLHFLAPTIEQLGVPVVPLVLSPASLPLPLADAGNALHLWPSALERTGRGYPWWSGHVPRTELPENFRRENTVAVVCGTTLHDNPSLAIGVEEKLAEGLERAERTSVFFGAGVAVLPNDSRVLLPMMPDLRGVLEHCATAIHIGDLNTAVETLWAGCVHIIVPFTPEQGDVASYLVSGGSGVMLPPHLLSPANFFNALSNADKLRPAATILAQGVRDEAKTQSNHAAAFLDAAQNTKPQQRLAA